MRPGSRLSAFAALVLVSAVSWLGCGGGGSDLTEPGRGTLEVLTATDGPEPDADGYALSFDDAAPVAVGTNAVVRRDGVPVGRHTVELSGLAANCTLAGPARREVTVTADAVVEAAFAVTCAPTTGTLQVTTTGGEVTDEDGFVVQVDGVGVGAIGPAATLTVPALAPGEHTVALTGVAANCAVLEDNPRTVGIAAGATAAVTFAVSCEPPPPLAGTLEIATTTTGESPDPDGYRLRLDGGTPQEIGTTATTSIANLAAGAHEVELLGVAANCTVGGANPRAVTVPAGGTVRVEFAVACSATTGRLAVSVTGLPGGTDAAVTVSGPGGFTRTVVATRTLDALQPGAYTVTAGEVTAGGTRYTGSPATQSANVTPGGTASVTVAYAAVATTLNLRIEGWHLTQGVQTVGNTVPMVANRDGYLRIFVVANENNTARPAVRVRIYRNGSVVSTLRATAPGASTPTARQEEPLSRSWNVRVPRELIGPGFALLADVDPDNAIDEQNEGDNQFPASGSPDAPQVRTFTPLGVTFVPVRQRANALQGDVTEGNRGRFLELTRKLYPLPGTDGSVHAVYTSGTENPLVWDNANNAWADVLGELDAVRIAEGTGRHYYGVVKVDYSSGLAGLAYVGAPTALGYDDEVDRGRVVAHELGHTWGRHHTPSCGASGVVDPEYPYAGGGIGVYGLDMGAEILKPPTEPDVMGYCGAPWISDYTYRAVQEYRARTGGTVATLPQPTLLVWGRIVDGRPVLEPAFELVTRPSLPARPGPYTVEGVTADGARVFSLSFEAVRVADDPRGTEQFAFAVPLDQSATMRLGSLRLAGPAGTTAAVRTVVPGAGVRAAPAIEARRAGSGVTVRWSAGAHPMAMVRDAGTGEVLSLARGGEVELPTRAGALEVLISDRVGSRRVVVPVAP